MSDNQIIRAIRDSRLLARMWDKLTTDQKREFLKEIEGDDWNLADTLIDFVAEAK